MMLARPRKHANNRDRQRDHRQRVRDTGTDELVAKRMKLVAYKDKDGEMKSGDPVLATCPLDVMLARKQLNTEEHQAGWIYLLLHRAVFGPSHAKTAEHDMVGRGSLASSYVDDIEGDKRRKAAYDRADKALKTHDRWARKLLRDVGLDGRPLDSEHSVGILRNGLRVLRREFGV